MGNLSHILVKPWWPVLGAICFCIISFLSAYILGVRKEWKRGRVGYVVSVSEEEGSY